MIPVSHEVIYNLQTLNITLFMVLQQEQQQIKEHKLETPIETIIW